MAPLAGARDHRWVDAQPLSGSSAGSFIACEPATVSIDDRSFSHDGDVSQPVVASPSTSAAPCEAAAAMAGPEPAAVSGGSRSTHAVSGSIHNRRWWPRGQHNKVSPKTLTHSSSSPSLFFYPNLDLRASLALVPVLDLKHKLGARSSE
jgi:hypothetical protein